MCEQIPFDDNQHESSQDEMEKQFSDGKGKIFIYLNNL